MKKKRSTVKITKTVEEIVAFVKMLPCLYEKLTQETNPISSYEIMMEYELYSIFPEIKLSYMQHCVRFALYGNNDKKIGKCFSGVLNQDEIKKYRSQLGKIRIKFLHNHNQLFYSKEKLLTAAKRGAPLGVIARGQTPFSAQEVLFLKKIIKENQAGYYVFYNKDNKKQYYTTRIAATLNKNYHNGLLVRSGKIVSAKITKLLKSEPL